MNVGIKSLFGAACAVVLFSVACQKADEPSSSGPKTATAGNPAPAGDKIKVVYIPKSAGNPYFAPVITGFKDAAAKLNVEFVDSAPQSAEATSQITIIKDQIQRKVDVIAISPNSPDALNAVLDDARAKGIKVITVDADLVGNESHRDAAVLPIDFSKVGESQVELLGSQINYEGPIAILSATRDAPNQNSWIEGMKKTLATPKYAKMKLVDTVYGDDEPSKSNTEMEGLLSKHPDLKGVISPTSVGLAAAAQSIQIAGVYPGGASAKNGGLFLTGLSTPNQMKKFVEKGVVKSFQLWSPHDMGWLACHLAVELKKGTVKATVGSEFEVPDLGKRKFEKNNVVNAGTLVTFDKSNIAKFDF